MITLRSFAPAAAPGPGVGRRSPARCSTRPGTDSARVVDRVPDRAEEASNWAPTACDEGCHPSPGSSGMAVERGAFQAAGETGGSTLPCASPRPPMQVIPASTCSMGHGPPHQATTNQVTRSTTTVALRRLQWQEQVPSACAFGRSSDGARRGRCRPIDAIIGANHQCLAIPGAGWRGVQHGERERGPWLSCTASIRVISATVADRGAPAWCAHLAALPGRIRGGNRRHETARGHRGWLEESTIEATLLAQPRRASGVPRHQHDIGHDGTLVAPTGGAAQMAAPVNPGDRLRVGWDRSPVAFSAARLNPWGGQRGCDRRPPRSTTACVDPPRRCRRWAPAVGRTPSRFSVAEGSKGSKTGS